jgi:hypothetical protein
MTFLCHTHDIWVGYGHKIKYPFESGHGEGNTLLHTILHIFLCSLNIQSSIGSKLFWVWARRTEMDTGKARFGFGYTHALQNDTFISVLQPMEPTVRMVTRKKKTQNHGRQT